MPLICLVENDPKSLKDMAECLATVAPEFKAEIRTFTSFAEFDAFKASEQFQNQTVQLLIFPLDLIQLPYDQSLQELKALHNTDLIVTCFDDPTKPLKKIQTWPVQNIIYKPFDLAIFKEHTRFALIKDQMAKTITVHTLKDKCQIEKIRKLTVTALSDFGFQFTSESDFEVGMAYKFYHPVFLDKKKQHIWARVTSKKDKTYDLIYCTLQHSIITEVRKKILGTTTKTKDVIWSTDKPATQTNKVKVSLQMSHEEEIQKLKDYFSRKFPEIEVAELPLQLENQKIKTDILITDLDYDEKKVEAIFESRPILIRQAMHPYPSREVAEEMLKFETVRFVQPLDRSILSKIIMTYFPFLNEVEANPVQWIPIEDYAFLQTEMILVEGLSEAALTYERHTQLEVGSFQEFTVPQEDETELTLLKGKVQFVDLKQTEEKNWKHQIVLYGVQDSMLKMIRLWMLQMYIQKNQKSS